MKLFLIASLLVPALTQASPCVSTRRICSVDKVDLATRCSMEVGNECVSWITSRAWSLKLDGAVVKTYAYNSAGLNAAGAAAQAMASQGACILLK